jgi:hypothetical protein
MIDEQNFPTITADRIEVGTQIWHEDEIRTVAKVDRYHVQPRYQWVRFNDGLRALFRDDRRFPLYVPRPPDEVRLLDGTVISLPALAEVDERQGW